ncbi:hypothetical protein LSAT2_000824, partial [Lamellibrachia satsuma]
MTNRAGQRQHARLEYCGRLKQSFKARLYVLARGARARYGGDASTGVRNARRGWSILHSRSDVVVVDGNGPPRYNDVTCLHAARADITCNSMISLSGRVCRIMWSARQAVSAGTCSQPVRPFLLELAISPSGCVCRSLKSSRQA